MARKKQNEQPAASLPEVAKEATDAGMSYGKYVGLKYIEEHAQTVQHTLDEKSADCIRRACEACGIDGHVVWFSNQIKPNSPDQKIAASTLNRNNFPAKVSFMYCDGLDMCFFYGPGGKAYCSYSGLTSAGSEDIRSNLVMAFKTAEKILDYMEKFF